MGYLVIEVCDNRVWHIRKIDYFDRAVELVVESRKIDGYPMSADEVENLISDKEIPTCRGFSYFIVDEDLIKDVS